MKKAKREDGFSLLEVMISIAIISFIAIFIIQMFIVASDGNKKAHDKDLAFLESTKIIETIKSYNNIDNCYKYFKQFEQKDAYYQYYLNNNWELDDIGSEKVLKEKDSYYKVTLKPIEMSSEAGTILQIEVSITAYEPDKNSELLTMKGSKYFPNLSRGDGNGN